VLEQLLAAVTEHPLLKLLDPLRLVALDRLTA